MKILFRTALTMLLLVALSATTFAVSRMNVYENVDLQKVQRLAIGMPQYYPPPNAPTVNEVMNTMFTASRVSKIMILSYDDIASNIKRDKHIDIKQLPPKKAMSIYAANIDKYADALVVATITSSGKRVGMGMFFEVRDAKDLSVMLCDYQTTAGRGEAESDSVFKALSEDFFHAFDNAVKKQAEDREVSAKEAAKAERQAVKDALKKNRAAKKSDK